MESFEEAFQLGAEGIEFDVQLTSDNRLVVMHDPTVDRMTNSKGYIREKTREEIIQLSFKKGNEKIPELADVLARFKSEDFLLNIEVKLAAWDRQAYINAIKPILKTFPHKEKIILSSFDHQILAALQQDIGGIEFAPISHGSLMCTKQYLQSHQFGSLHFKYTTRDTAEVQGLISRGFKIRPYTINDVKWLKQYFSLGADGIITDDVISALNVRKDSCK